MKDKQFTKLDVVGGPGVPELNVTEYSLDGTTKVHNVCMFENGFGDVSGTQEFNPEGCLPDEIIQEWMNKQNACSQCANPKRKGFHTCDIGKKPKSKIKIKTRFGRITIEDPTLSEPMILQITDGQCCVRPTQEQLDYLKHLAAIIRTAYE